MAWAAGTGPEVVSTTTNEQWWADELNLSTVAYNVSKMIISLPEPKGSHIELPQRDGHIFTPNRSYRPGEFGLGMWIIGAEPDGAMPGTRTLRRQVFNRNLSHLLSVITNETRPILLRHQQPGTALMRQAYVSVNDSTSLETMAAMQRAEFAFTFILRDSFWEDSTTTTEATTASSTLPKTLDLAAAVSMSAPVKDAVVTITGPVTNPRVTNPETGVWTEMVGTLASGKNLVIDSKNSTATVDGAAVPIRHYGNAALVYIPTRQGNTSLPRLVLSGTSGGTTTKMSVTYRRKWKTP